MTSYMNVAALLPAYTATHHPGISAAINGVLIAAYQVTFFFMSPLIGAHMGRLGRKNCIAYGVVMLTISTAMFALAALFTDPKVFWSVSFVARCLQGAADGIAYIPLTAIISIEFPERPEVYQAYVTMSLGLGCAIGPALAAIVIRWFGYMGTNLFFAALIFVIGFAGIYVLP